MKKSAPMKSTTLTRITAITLFAGAIALFSTLAIPDRLTASSSSTPPHYNLIDVPTLGGPNAVVNGPGVPDLSNTGIYQGYAETTIPDPYAPNCQNPECLVYHTQQWQNGVVTDLGALPGVNNSGTSWISANGQFISGGSQNGLIDPQLGTPESRAVVWTNGKIAELATLKGGNESFAAAVNSVGQVTGVSANGVADPFSLFGYATQTRAVLWQNGKIRDLGTLGGPDAFADSINESGQISGISYTNSTPNATTGVPTIHPFFWQNGKMIDIGTLGGTNSFAESMDNQGEVVGEMNLAGDMTQHPFFWVGGVLTDIGTFGGSNGEALRISNSGGWVVGRADFAGDFIHHAYVWRNGVKADVQPVAGDLCTNGRAINSLGQAVGTSTNCKGVTRHLFLWENGSTLDLNSLILGQFGIKLVEVLDINDNGVIAALGILPNGDQHAVLLIPASK